jgi:hypothetical protein
MGDCPDFSDIEIGGDEVSPISQVSRNSELVKQCWLTNWLDIRGGDLK